MNRKKKEAINPNWKSPFGTLLENQEFVTLPTTVNGEPCKIPVFVDLVFKNLRDFKGIDNEGIFRISGNATTVKKMKEMMEKGEKTSFGKEDDAFDVASLLKLYFRELPNPLLTFELYDCFIAIQGMPEEQRNYAMKQVLSMLPKLNIMLLITLCDFLREIVQHKEKNKMTPENLAICFAPNLLRPQTDSIAVVLGDSGFANATMRQLLLHSEKVFEQFTQSEKKVEPSPEVKELRNELRETYSTLRKAQAEKMKKEFQENVETIGVDEQEKKIAEEYAKAVTGVADEEINSDTIVAEEFRKVYSNTLRRTGKWTIEITDDENKDKNKDNRKSEEISSAVLVHLHQQPTPSYGQPPVPVAKLGANPPQQQTASVKSAPQQTKVPQKTPSNPRQQKSLVIRKVKEVKPDDLAKIYFG